MINFSENVFESGKEIVVCLWFPAVPLCFLYEQNTGNRIAGIHSQIPKVPEKLRTKL